MPPISINTINQSFEFVLHNSPRASSIPDPETFKSYFDINSTQHGIVAFKNLGGDALLVVPSPYRRDANYSGLAEFFRKGLCGASWPVMLIHDCRKNLLGSRSLVVEYPGFIYA